MKIHEDVLPPHLLKKCLEEFREYQQQQVWGISTLYWEEFLQDSSVGSVSLRFLSEETSVEVHKELNKYYPSEHNDETLYQYYVWNKMSGISNHNDGMYNFGATLYLNKLWESNWGGLFVWKDKNEKKEYKFNTICPQQNMLIINDEHEMHLVTPTASTIPYPRITIQIWFERKEKK